MYTAQHSVCFENVTLGYERHPAVHHVSTQIERGTLLAIVGPNGSGKSTLLKGIVGELKPLEGHIHINDELAYLPQQRDIDTSFPVCVFEFVAMGLWKHLGAWRGLSKAHASKVESALARVGLKDFARRAIGSLSGGQMQRLLFARLLLQNAPLILLDEPFNAIDQKTAADLLQLLVEWHAEGRTVIAVLHDLEQVKHYFPETLLLAREMIGRGQTAEVLSPVNLFRARQLCEAFDEHANVCHRQHGRAA